MSILPEVSDREAVSYDYFPTTWQTVVWRNWGYIPISRIAKALEATIPDIQAAARLMGLDPEQATNVVWEKRGYLTVIRNNWHLCSYEQIQTLLNVTDEMLAFILKEDDFMWVKLGRMKPQVQEPKYALLTEEQIQQTTHMAEVLRNRFPAVCERRDNAFEFIEEYSQPLTCEPIKVQESENLRMVYPYFTLYGDALLDESIDPLPDYLLQQYAKSGINGIWMRIVLYQVVEFPFEPALSKDWEIRIKNLKKLVARAKKYGIGIYPYLNEPRAMRSEFYEKYPHLKGSSENGFYSMCTSTKEVQDYLYNGMKKLFEMVPDLAGFFTITMSENLTNCISRTGGRPVECPRCKRRERWEIVAEVNNLMAKGAHAASPSAKAIVWTWGWPADWADKAAELLTEGQILQCNSEQGVPFCINGVNGNVSDYSMSVLGPGAYARKVWNVAKGKGMEISAKVQINTTWEIATVPYIPVFDKVEEHINALKEQGVKHLQASWTLGGCPSPNLNFSAWLMENKGTCKEFLMNWLGKEMGEKVDAAQKQLSRAFSQFPFHIGVLYYGPQNFGPMAPFFLTNTGYEASMVGYPYDHLEKWVAIYPCEIYEKQFASLCAEWEKGVHMLQNCQDGSKEVGELLLISGAILCHFKSALHHIKFVMLRDSGFETNKTKMLHVVQEEMKNVKELIELREQDSRIGYESSNHYFYSMQDLKEKLVNLLYCEEQLTK